MAGDHKGYAKSQWEDCFCITADNGQKICEPDGCKSIDNV